MALPGCRQRGRGAYFHALTSKPFKAGLSLYISSQVHSKTAHATVQGQTPRSTNDLHAQRQLSRPAGTRWMASPPRGPQPWQALCLQPATHRRSLQHVEVAHVEAGVLQSPGRQPRSLLHTTEAQASRLAGAQVDGERGGQGPQRPWPSVPAVHRLLTASEFAGHVHGPLMPWCSMVPPSPLLPGRFLQLVCQCIASAPAPHPHLLNLPPPLRMQVWEGPLRRLVQRGIRSHLPQPQRLPAGAGKVSMRRSSVAEGETVAAGGGMGHRAVWSSRL